MIDERRQNIPHGLERLSEFAPDVRFWTIDRDLALLAKGPWDETLWNLSDEELFQAIEQQAVDLSTREEAKRRMTRS